MCVCVSSGSIPACLLSNEGERKGNIKGGWEGGRDLGGVRE